MCVTAWFCDGKVSWEGESICFDVIVIVMVRRGLCVA